MDCNFPDEQLRAWALDYSLTRAKNNGLRPSANEIINESRKYYGFIKGNQAKLINIKKDK